LLPVTAVDDGKTKLDNEGIADLRACKRIVDMYAGRLWLQAQEAGKTSVFITIPAQGTPLGTPYRAPAELLVLEDDIEILNLFRRHATR
ncbi:hypothetical protein, partial [Parvimonas sp. M13]|uniref:hypothetical protein n=1 Tax=Parvimonas sp. M13 TaxID=3110694 RepID=UPI002B4809C0